MVTSEQWKQQAIQAFEAANAMYELSLFRDSASRSYYSAYQIATSACIGHGDEKNFPSGWNNPSHEQLPELIKSNGDLPKWDRKEVAHHLRYLRTIREDADYRPGRTVDAGVSLSCLRAAASVLRCLGVKKEE